VKPVKQEKPVKRAEESQKPNSFQDALEKKAREIGIDGISVRL